MQRLGFNRLLGRARAIGGVAIVVLTGCSVADEVQTATEQKVTEDALAIVPSAGGEPSRRDAEEFALPEPTAAQMGERLKLWATHYYTPLIVASETGKPLTGRVNQAISAPVTERQWCDAALQGAALIGQAGGAVTAYSALDTRGLPQADCGVFRGLTPEKRAEIERTRFCKIDPADGPLGCGAEERPLRAFRSVTVDPATIPLGTTLYIAAARGKTFVDQNGDQRVHDGYFFAADAGGAVSGAQIDVFGGASDKNPFPNFIKSSKSRRFEAIVIDEDSPAARWLAAQHPSGTCGCSPF